MISNQVAVPVKIKNILYLTDFSAASEAALPFAVGLAHKFGAAIEGLHVLTPVIPESCTQAIQADLALAEPGMKKVQSRIAGVPCQTAIVRGMSVWEAVDHAIREYRIDLIVMGTHGRTGAMKLTLGSVAEEVFRRSPVPVLTVGPNVQNVATGLARFGRMLLATDFTSASEAASEYAVSLAQENRAWLVLMHVMPQPPAGPDNMISFEISVAKAIEQLREISPGYAEPCNLVEVAIEYGEPAERIVVAARKRCADLIVLGVRGAAGHLGAATHLERATAHKIVVHAPCPVLTVRAKETAAAAGERTLP